jgi:Mg-chelatase subunit ChlD
MKSIKPNKHLAAAPADVDLDPKNTYKSTEDDTEEESKAPQEFLEVEPKQNEYIFLIDRSGSMDETIRLARQALQLFLQSLT